MFWEIMEESLQNTFILKNLDSLAIQSKSIFNKKLVNVL